MLYCVQESDVRLADFPDCINKHKKEQHSSSSHILLPISSVRQDTSNYRRTCFSENDVFDQSKDVHLLAKEDENTSPPGSAVQCVYSQSNGMDYKHRGSILTTSSIELIDTNPYNLEVGCVIQHGEPARCGVIKWMGGLPDKTDMFAGVEMVS